MRTVERAGKRLKLLTAGINLGWAMWATFGGLYLLHIGHRMDVDTLWTVFGKYMHGYAIVGWSLVACGAVSFASVGVRSLGKWAAILCAVWCATVSVALQIGASDHNDPDLWIYTWLLVICAFTCVMRWALLMLEPHIVQ